MKKNNSHEAHSNSTRDRLLRAALDEFAEKGYLKAGVKSITRKANLSYGTFYLYFKNKTDLLIQLLEENSTPFPAQIDAVKAWLNADTLSKFSEPIYRFILNDFNFSGLHKAYAQGFVYNKAIYDLYFEGLNQTADIFIPKIKLLKKAGAYTGCDEKITAYILATALFSPYFLYSIGTIQCRLEDLIDNVSYFLFAAINFNKKMVPDFSKYNGIPSNTRKKILTAAREEFAKTGYLKTNVFDIVNKAGYSRGTFYQHFRDKDDLIRCLGSDMLSATNPFDCLSDESPPGFNAHNPDYLLNITAAVYAGFKRIGDLTWTFLQSIYYSDRLNDSLSTYLNFYSHPVVDKLEQLKAQGQCRSVNSPVMARIILTTMGYMAFMTTTDMIPCSKYKFSTCMSRVLYNFTNFNPEYAE